MRESDFRDAYRKAHQGVEVTEDLKRRTLAFVAAEPAPAKPRARWKLAAAACLAVVMVAAGLTLALPSDDVGRDAQPEPPARAGFSLLAYAATTGEPLEPAEDGSIVFERSLGELASKDFYATEGCYTGCLFSVQGEGIVRVQATTSRGQLYRQTYEEFRMGDEPQKWLEALSWDPTKRGTGAYYSEYDNVTPMKTDPARSTDDPDATVRVLLSKKLGATVDVPMEPGEAEGYRFGLWTNDPYAEGYDPGEAVIGLFEGETLTITVEFEDGSMSTKSVDLHATDVELERGFVARTLVGEVFDESDGPFPAPLDQANELESAVEPPAQLGRESDAATETLMDGGDFVLPASRVLGPSDSALLAEANQTFTRGNGTTFCGEGDGMLEISNVRADLSRRLPDGVDAMDTEVVRFDTLSYFNKCQDELHGFTISEDGRISGYYLYVAVSMDVTNRGDAPAWKSTSNFSKLAMRRADGLCLRLNTLLLYSDWWGHDRASEDFETRTLLQPGETRRMTQVFAAPAAYAEAAGLLFVAFDSFTSEPFEENYHAFDVGQAR
ncbi:hypothetical protein [Arabiibacter massiliensis]|uniref:hypothetical protein n=1 Tax=Arabiibacter massiliensis TaxID=1870985 RepID=UPI0009BA21B5|nr:hypothetical protein [Arabiibacter massiliensis]